MLRNYFKLAVRSLLHNKAFSAINIVGLALGMASAIFILLWIQHEVSFDRYHAYTDRLYQVHINDKVDGGVQTGVPTPEVMAPVLEQETPEIAATARLGWSNAILMTRGDKQLKGQGAWADPAILRMFSLPMLKGNPQTALQDAYSIVLTETLARKLFGDEDPLGKMVRLDNADYFTVTGVLKDLPANTQLDFQFLNSVAYKKLKGYLDTDWGSMSMRTFVLLKPHADADAVNRKIKDIIVRHSNGTARTTIFLYPISKKRLYSHFENGKATGGRIALVRTFGIIAGLILLIACINFMNLGTARSEKRAREVGVRKAVGAHQRSLVLQFICESVLLALIAGIIAIIVVQLCLPAFNRLTDKALFIDYANWRCWAWAVGFILFTGLLAGSYPAFFLSSLKPVVVLKGTFKKVHGAVTPRKVLVVVQFTCAIALIISTVVIYRQVRYGQQRSSGYDNSNLVYIYMEGDISKNYRQIREQLLESGAALAVSKTMSPLTQLWSSGHSLTWQGKAPGANVTFVRSSTDGNLLKTAGLQLLMGRDIDVKKFPTDSTACLINEAAMKVMGFKDPIGQVIYDEPVNWHIVGVIKDFIVESPYEPIRPMIFKGPAQGMNVMHVRLNSAHALNDNLATAERIFRQFNPDYPFEYHFLADNYATKFADEQRTGNLVALFAGLAILLSCLGLLGLAAYTAASRVKEIGIRKVLGASAFDITTLLSKDFVKLVVIAFVFAAPVAYLAMRSWLQGYSYRVNISAWIFVAAGGMAVIISLLTVGYHAVKAAMENPAQSLRTE